MTLQEQIEQNDITITVSDAREFFRGCIPGWQMFCNTHGFIWKEVVRNGLKASQLYNTNDAMAISLVEWKYNV